MSHFPSLFPDSLINRQREGFLPNGAAGYYNSLGKTSIGLSSYQSSHSLKSPSYNTSPYSSPTYPPSYAPPPSSSYPSAGAGSSSGHHHPPPQPYTRTLPAQPILPSRLGTLSPLVEEYPHRPPPYHHHYSSLPRKRSAHGHYLRDEGPPMRSRSSSMRASVEDRYHLMHEWKENPKYLIRTHDREADDESFV